MTDGTKKKIMLFCDTFASCSTVAVFILLKTDKLTPLFMYILNAVSGLMNTIQQPASEVTMTLVIPKEKYQKTSGLQTMSNSMITILQPIVATFLFATFGMECVIFVDLITFVIAFVSLLLFIKLPKLERSANTEVQKKSVLAEAKEGLKYLKQNPMVLYLILFLASVNLVASCFNATLPAYVLPRANEKVLGFITSSSGIAMFVGGFFVTVLPKPKNRIEIITNTMLFSLTVENLFLAFTDIPALWCLAQALGWFVVPIMNANLNVVLRSTISVSMQGRVYACRNSLQFFTIPIGLFLGGGLVDNVFEPLILNAKFANILQPVFGSSKGSGAAIMMGVLGLLGAIVCLVFKKLLSKYTFVEENA